MERCAAISTLLAFFELEEGVEFCHLVPVPVRALSIDWYNAKSSKASNNKGKCLFNMQVMFCGSVTLPAQPFDVNAPG